MNKNYQCTHNQCVCYEQCIQIPTRHVSIIASIALACMLILLSFAYFLGKSQARIVAPLAENMVDDSLSDCEVRTMELLALNKENQVRDSITRQKTI